MVWAKGRRKHGVFGGTSKKAGDRHGHSTDCSVARVHSWAGKAWLRAEIQPCFLAKLESCETLHQLRGKSIFFWLSYPEGHLYWVPSRVPEGLTRCWWLEDSKIKGGWSPARLEICQGQALRTGSRAKGSGLYPKNREKLMTGSKCICVWWTDLHFEKITLVAVWKTN
jgi:hypothetical protein